jgi:autotransporter-associated beta strand protein
MKNLSGPLIPSLLLAGLVAWPNLVTAQSYWDPGALNANPGSGGTGTWNSTIANWWVSGNSDTIWTPGNVANFSDSSGTVTLGAPETVDGITFATSGYILSGSPTLTLAGTPIFTVPSGGIATISSVIGDGGAGIPLTISGGGTLVLSATNTFSGGITVTSDNTLTLTAVAGAGTGTIALGTDSVLNINNRVSNFGVTNGITTADSTGIIYVASPSGNTYLKGSLAGFTGTIICTSSGGADFTGVNTTPPLTMPTNAIGWIVNPGAELYLGIGASGVESAPVTINGPGYTGGYGAIRLDSGTVAGNILLNGATTNNQLGGATAGNVHYSGVISDGGNGYGLNIWGGGSTPASKAFVLSGENTYGGPTTLTFGELQLGSAENPGVSGPLGASNAQSIIYFSAAVNAGVTGGALQYSSSNQYDYSGRFSSADNQQYKIDVNGQSVAFANSLASSGGTFLLFDTAGGGTLTLNTSNSYTGSTTITNAVLVANAAGAVPGTGAIKLTGGTLTAGATGAVGGPVTVSAGSLIAAAADSVLGNITISGTSGLLTMSNDSALPTNATLTLPTLPVAGEVSLNFSGTQTISGLYFGAASQAGGTWGALGSSAANRSSVFTGTGVLNVVPPVYPSSYWDPGALKASPGSGGDGTWNGSLANWWTNGSSDTTWSGQFATFAGAAGTVTLGDNETAQGLSFSTPGYTLTSSSSSVLALVAPETVSVGNGSATVSCPIGGAVGLTQIGMGTLMLSGTNTYTGPTTIAGTLTIGGAGQLDSSGTYLGNIFDFGTFIYNGSLPQTLAGTISDSGFGAVVQEGLGLLTLSGANTYSGNTTVNAGCALQLNNVAGAGTSTIALATNSTLTIVNHVSNASVPNPITGDPSTVINVTSGSADNTDFSGSLAGFYGAINCTSSAGTGFTGVNTTPPLSMPSNAVGWVVSPYAELYIGVSGGTEAAPITLNGPGPSPSYGAIRLDAGAISGNVLLNGSGSQIGGANSGNVTISGVISDGGNNYDLNIWGGGSTPANKVFVLSGQNTYGGPTTLSYGELQVASPENPGISGPLGASNTSSTITFSAASNAGATGGALQYSTVNRYDYSGRFSSNPNQPYKIDVNGQSVTFASPLTSSAGTFLLFDSLGGGSLTLSATNTYTGGTIIDSGTLDISLTGSIASSVTNNGGTLELDNSAALPLGAILSVSAGATVNLTYAGTAYITNLVVAGVQQAPGVYGAGANNPGGVFTGSGTLTIGILPPVTVSSASVQNSQLVISWTSVPGGIYNVYSTTDLSLPPSSWTVVAYSIPSTGTNTSYTLPGDITDNPQLFVLIQQ